MCECVILYIFVIIIDNERKDFFWDGFFCLCIEFCFLDGLNVVVCIDFVLGF